MFKELVAKGKLAVLLAIQKAKQNQRRPEVKKDEGRKYLETGCGGLNPSLLWQEPLRRTAHE